MCPTSLTCQGIARYRTARTGRCRSPGWRTGRRGLVVANTGLPNGEQANKAAWAKLAVSPTPMLVALSDRNPITGPMAAIFQREMRGAKGVDHPTIRGAGHVLQEDAGEELAAHIVEFLRR